MIWGWLMLLSTCEFMVLAVAAALTTPESVILGQSLRWAVCLDGTCCSLWRRVPLAMLVSLSLLWTSTLVWATHYIVLTPIHITRYTRSISTPQANWHWYRAAMGPAVESISRQPADWPVQPAPAVSWVHTLAHSRSRRSILIRALKIFPVRC